MKALKSLRLDTSGWNDMASKAFTDVRIKFAETTATVTILAGRVTLLEKQFEEYIRKNESSRRWVITSAIAALGTVAILATFLLTFIFHL